MRALVRRKISRASPNGSAGTGEIVFNVRGREHVALQDIDIGISTVKSTDTEGVFRELILPLERESG